MTIRGRLISFWGDWKYKRISVLVYYPKEGRCLYPDRLGMYWIIGIYKKRLTYQFTDQRKSMKP